MDPKDRRAKAGFELGEIVAQIEEPIGIEIADVARRDQPELFHRGALFGRPVVPEV